MVHKEITGAVNETIFLEYIRKDLAPTLKRVNIVIMDNLNVHKSVFSGVPITSVISP